MDAWSEMADMPLDDMLTPLNNPTSSAERAYNSAQILARNCIENHRYGEAPIPSTQIRFASEAVIVGTVVLHNIAVTPAEDEPGDNQFEKYL